jgi:hypothetical protein
VLPEPDRLGVGQGSEDVIKEDLRGGHAENSTFGQPGVAYP